MLTNFNLMHPANELTSFHECMKTLPLKTEYCINKLQTSIISVQLHELQWHANSTV